ncbi:MAG: MMPL family transporter [Acidothermus sp.]|nr:MMPL family transporter [Acidothermus sp.]MCL6538125.1 MMPL family transporter [Acidothermus sp.]
MFERLGAVVFHRRRVIALIGLLMLILAALWGGDVTKRLSSGGYYDPHSESVRAANAISDVLHLPSSDATVLFSAKEPITAPGPTRAITSALRSLPKTVVPSYVSYWNTGQRRLISTDGRATYVVLELAGSTDAEKGAALQVVKQRLATLAADGISVGYAGAQPLNKEISGQVSRDLKRAEALSLPATLVLLLVIFGSVVSAALPVVVGICGIIGAFAILRFLTIFTNVSIFAQNLVTMLGLGLAIDYALFMVSRFREEMTGTDDVATAVRRTLATAGRTVAFSGVTVMVSTASLTLFPEDFLRSMGYGGVAVVALDALAALTVLPAILAMLGRRVDALRLPWFGPRRRTAEAGPAEAGPAAAARGFWYRLARSVMRRPVLYALPIVALLVFMALPFRHVTFGGYTAKVLPADAPGRIVSETLARDFPGNETTPIQIVVEDFPNPVSLQDYVSRIAAVPGTVEPHVVAVRGNDALVEVGYHGDGISSEARHTLGLVRAVAPPPGSHVLVGGLTAFLVDQLHSIGRVLPWMLAVIAVAMAVLLFLAFGSVILPLKAIVMNTLSIAASFGAITWIFQEGHLARLLDFSPLGYLDATDPILLLAVVFGLSMDYEVFLLSRIREEWDLSAARRSEGTDPGERNTAAVAIGLQRSGRIITSAALLLIVVIGLFATSRITTLKLLGVGMALAIAVDATVVRALLVPAVMRLLGRVNWWAPGPLARWWATHGLRERIEAPEAEPIAAGGRADHR